jgi:hypothetical protein
VLPPINITAKRPRPRAKPTARAATTADVPPAASAGPQQTPAAPPSGAPNVAAGPAAAPGMASQMAVTGDELNARPVTRPGEIVEAAPGLIATQHSGEGKANQYFPRGYNLDHGTDLAITVDDMPINMRTHAHGQGYADLNFLMRRPSTRWTSAKARISPMLAISARSARSASASSMPRRRTWRR